MAGSLKDFSRRIKGSDEALLKASELIRKEVLMLIDEGFKTETDPIGRKWAKRKAWYEAYLRRGGRAYPILSKTLTLRNGFYFRVSKKGVIFGNDAPYAQFHQDGTSRMAARKMIPDNSLSPKWRARIAKVLPQALRDYFNRV